MSSGLGVDEWLEGDGAPREPREGEVRIPAGELKEHRAKREEKKAADRVREELEAKIRKLEERLDQKKEDEERVPDEAVLSPSLPSPDETIVPIADFRERGILQGYAWLRDHVRAVYASIERRTNNRRAVGRWIAAWYATPDQAEQTAMAVPVKQNFLDRPFKLGTYYVRIRAQEGKDSDQDVFFVCKLGKKAGDPGAQDRRTSTNLIALQTLEELRVEKRRVDEENSKLREERDSLQEEVRELKDDHAEQARTIKALEAEVEALKAAGEPFLDKEAADQVASQGFMVLNQWLQDPGKGAREYIDKQKALLVKMFDAHCAFLKGVVEHEEIAELLVRGRPGVELWDPFVGVFNEIAAYGDRPERILPSAQIVARLPPPMAEDLSDDAILAAAEARVAEAEQREEQARRLVEEADAERVAQEKEIERLKRQIEKLKGGGSGKGSTLARLSRKG